MYKYRKPGGQFISYVMRDREGEGGGGQKVSSGVGFVLLFYLLFEASTWALLSKVAILGDLSAGSSPFLLF